MNYKEKEEEEEEEEGEADNQEENNKIESNSEFIKKEEFIMTDINLEEIDDPQEREAVLLAVIKRYKERLKSKEESIAKLKSSMEEDDNIKKIMNDKIQQLRSQIQEYKDSLLKNDEMVVAAGIYLIKTEMLQY
jgi:hypothetical protein